MTHNLPSARALECSMGNGFDEILITIDRDFEKGQWVLGVTGLRHMAREVAAGFVKEHRHHTLDQAKEQGREYWRKYARKGFTTRYTKEQTPRPPKVRRAA